MDIKSLLFISVITIFSLLFQPVGINQPVRVKFSTSPTIERISVASNGTQTNQESYDGTISSDGRYVAFSSQADNLVIGDTNGYPDIFVHDQQAGTIELISVASDGTQSNGYNAYPSISADGRYVAFTSGASNLVSSDTNGSGDVFVRDRQTGITELVSVASDGTQGNDISFFYQGPTISADGRYVTFFSAASNLVIGDTNGSRDIFVHDRQSGNTERVSVATDGTQGNGYSESSVISATGRYIVFDSDATNLVSGDVNSAWDVFIHDQLTGITELVSLSSNNTHGNKSSGGWAVSEDGRYVVFGSIADNLVNEDTNANWDIFVRDRQTGTTECVSVGMDNLPGNGYSGGAGVSADWRYIVFSSSASNLVNGDTNEFSDVFVRDRQNNITERFSLTGSGAEANNNSWGFSISADGRYVVIDSDASNLVTGDTNEFRDVFLIDRGTAISTYSISGVVKDNFANPIAGVTVSDDGINSTVTANDGTYLLTGLLPGTYTLNAKLNGYTFTPISRVIYLPPNQTNQDFEGSLIPLVDLSIVSVTPIQVIEGADLVLNKNTAVKVVIHKSGNASAANVSVRLNYGSWASRSFFVAESSNIDAQNKLINDNSTKPLNFNNDDTDKVIYFFSESLKPTGNSMQVSATIEYADQDEKNNTQTSRQYNVINTQWSDSENPEFSNYFFKVDWYNTPTFQFTKDPLTVFNDYINISSRFLKGLYPVADSNFISLKSDYYADTRPDRLGFRFDKYTLTTWVFENWLGLQMALPTVDRFIAVVPPTWFSNYTASDNGDNLSGAAGFHSPMVSGFVIVEARDSIALNQGGQQFVPHEIGHSYGLIEYDTTVPSGTGLWVNERLLVQNTANQPVISFMDGWFNWPNPEKSWMDLLNYNRLLINHQVNSLTEMNAANTSSKVILVTGIAEQGGQFTLGNWYVLPKGNLSEIGPGPYSFEYQNSNGDILYKKSFDVSFSINGLPSGELNQIPFGFVLPYVEGVSNIILKNREIEISRKNISPNSPSVNLLTPNGGEKINGFLKIEWQADDLDNDPLNYSIFFSSDNGSTWFPIAVNLFDTHFDWNAEGIKAGSQYLLKVMATDGFNTSEDLSSSCFTILSDLFLPIITR